MATIWTLMEWLCILRWVLCGQRQRFKETNSPRIIEIPKADPDKSVLKLQNRLDAAHDVVQRAVGSSLMIIPASAWLPLKMQRRQDIFCIKFSSHQAVPTAPSNTHKDSPVRMMKFLKPVLSLWMYMDFKWRTQCCVIVHRFRFWMLALPSAPAFRIDCCLS